MLRLTCPSYLRHLHWRTVSNSTTWASFSLLRRGFERERKGERERVSPEIPRALTNLFPSPPIDSFLSLALHPPPPLKTLGNLCGGERASFLCRTLVFMLSSAFTWHIYHSRDHHDNINYSFLCNARISGQPGGPNPGQPQGNPRAW